MTDSSSEIARLMGVIADLEREKRALQARLDALEARIAAAPVVEPYCQHISLTGSSTEIHGPGWLFWKPVRLLPEDDEVQNDALQEHRRIWPECSGDPASCPENEGRGCCQPNNAKLSGGCNE